MKFFNHVGVDREWALFLDRDGVINIKSEELYVLDISQFNYIQGSLEAIVKLTSIFGWIFVITNQRGVGRGLMTEEALNLIHWKLSEDVRTSGGKIDAIYFCSDVNDDSVNRKPNIGMALTAKMDYPDINFSKSIMVGDSISDIQFGENLGMMCCLIHQKQATVPKKEDLFLFRSLEEFSNTFSD